jgi:hypothetical protein
MSANAIFAQEEGDVELRIILNSEGPGDDNETSIIVSVFLRALGEDEIVLLSPDADIQVAE